MAGRAGLCTNPVNAPGHATGLGSGMAQACSAMGVSKVVAQGQAYGLAVQMPASHFTGLDLSPGSAFHPNFLLMYTLGGRR